MGNDYNVQQITQAAASGGAGYALGMLGGKLAGLSDNTKMLIGAGAGAYSAYSAYGSFMGTPSLINSPTFTAAGAAAAGYMYPVRMLGPWGSAAAYGAGAYYVLPMVIQAEP